VIGAKEFFLVRQRVCIRRYICIALSVWHPQDRFGEIPFVMFERATHGNILESRYLRRLFCAHGECGSRIAVPAIVADEYGR